MCILIRYLLAIQVERKSTMEQAHREVSFSGADGGDNP